MFQVLRWGALAFGVFYGFSHQAAITTKDKVAASKHEYERKEKLINEAKAAWAQKNAPKGQGNGCELLQLSVKSGKTDMRTARSHGSRHEHGCYGIWTAM